MLFPIGAPLIPSPYLQPLASYSTPNISGSRPWPFNVTWRRRSHDDSRYDSPYAVPYSCSVRTKSLSPSVFEIFGSKYIWGTTLTLWGHVISSGMWPFDTPYSISYGCSIKTKPLSLSVFVIFSSKVPVQCKWSLRMRDITWPVPLCKIWVHIWISRPHIAYSLWHIYWAPTKNKGCLLLKPPMLNAKSSEVMTKIGQILAVFGVWGQVFQKVAIFTPKRHVLAWTHVVLAILRQNKCKKLNSLKLSVRMTWWTRTTKTAKIF